MSLTVLMNAGPWLPVPPAGYGGIENVVATLVPGAAPARGAGGAGLGGAEHAAGGRAPDVVRRRPVRGAAAAVQPGVRGGPGAPARGGAGAARPGRHRPGARPRGGGRAGDAGGGAGARTPRRCCTPCTGTWPSTPSCTATSTAAAGSGSTGSPPPSWPGRPQALRGALGRARAPGHPAGRGRRPATAGRRRATTRSSWAGSTRARVRTSAPGWPSDRGFDWCWPARSARTTGRRTWPRRASEARQNPDVRFWLRPGAPHVDGGRVRWVGTVAGRERDDLVAAARAALFPLRWEEPGGTAVVESLALGTPVVATGPGLPAGADRARAHRSAHRDEEELGELLLAAAPAWIRTSAGGRPPNGSPRR